MLFGKGGGEGAPWCVWGKGTPWQGGVRVLPGRGEGTFNQSSKTTKKKDKANMVT